MQKREELYRGKAKTVYRTDDENYLVLHFRDDTSAFDGEKVAQLQHKGAVNNQFNHFIMTRLEQAGIPTQLEKLLSADEALVKKLDMLPVECVVRNVAAGSICRRLGIAEGMELKPPTFEFFLKNDALHDPMINEYHMRCFGWASESDIAKMKAMTFEVNRILQALFAAGDLILVDYKLEFGTFQGELILGDEFTPDGCRLWDKETKTKLDKDRFRQGLGGVVDAYKDVARRIGLDL